MSAPPTRSLLLAGGGLKVAFQAGVLQVLLSEAHLRFDHIDACSGGAFNLALLCNGRRGIEIADLWRKMRPRDGVSISARGLVHGASLVTMDGYRTKVFPGWDLDWDRIRASQVPATFTVHNRTKGRREVFTPSQMDEDRLVATLSQALWFPPVEIDGELYTDAVFDTDANVDEAVERGADEIWVIWTVSRRPEWMPGAFAQFFHVLEISANGTLEADLERIRWNNEHGHGLFGRHIEVKVLRAEVGIHYLALLGGDRLHRGVEAGVRAARAWCDQNRIRYTPEDRSHFYDSEVTLTFADHLHGRLGGCRAAAELTLTVADSGEFVNAGRQRVAVTGTIASSIVNGRATVERGYADILTDARTPPVVTSRSGVVESDEGVDPTRKVMTYLLHLRTPHEGRAVTFVGIKDVSSRSVGGTAHDATTMDCRLFHGHLPLEDTEGATPFATGLIWMNALDIAKQLVGARAAGPDLRSRAGGLARYGALFAGSLWDVCARKVLTYAPF
jgi:predicted patatin/cPLA2 family phospholipase